MKPRAFQPSPWDDPAPLYREEHRALAKQLDVGKLEADVDLQDSGRVGPRLGQLGLYRWLLPGENGAVDVRSLCTVREILAYTTPLADAVFAVQGLCANPLLLAGRRDLVDRMVSGERIGGFALTEPEAGSDVAAMKTTAKPDAGGWLLDGEKTLISNVGIAHHFVVFAKVEGAPKPISAFLVEADAPGVELVGIPMSGHHPLGRIVLSSCRLPKEALLGQVGQGLRLALGTLESYRTSVGAAALGMAWRALEDTLAHVTAREQFGQKLSEMQLVQAALADMATELRAARLLVASVARAKDEAPQTQTHGPDVAMAKMHATETAQRIIDRAVQLHGGMGVVLGTKVEELYREVRPLRIYEGATDVLKLVVASGLLKRGS